MNIQFIFIISTIPFLVSGVLYDTNADTKKCMARRFGYGDLACGDGTLLDDSHYCGYGRCNIFGYNCDGGCRNPSTMIPFNTGDVIVCYLMNILDISTFHVMLALNDREIVHITNIDATEFFNKGAIIERDLFANIVKSKDYNHCQIVTEYMDKVALRYNLLPLSTADMISKVSESMRKYQNTTLPYHVHDRNCEHWVTSWKYNSTHGFSIQECNIGCKIIVDIYNAIKSKNVS